MDEERLREVFDEAMEIAGVKGRVHIEPEDSPYRSLYGWVFRSKPLSGDVYFNEVLLGNEYEEDTFLYASLHELSHIKHRDAGVRVEWEQRAFREAYEWLTEARGEEAALEAVETFLLDYSDYAESTGLVKKEDFYEDYIDKWFPSLMDKLPSKRP